MIALLITARFWRLFVFCWARKILAIRPATAACVPAEFPDVDIIVPARDEAQHHRRGDRSLLAQDYAGQFRVILVDDNSTDGTAASGRHGGRG